MRKQGRRQEEREMMEETGHQVGKWGEGQGGGRCRRRERRAPGWLDAADPAGRAQGARDAEANAAGSPRAPARQRGTRGSQRTQLLPQDFLRQHAHSPGVEHAR